MEEHVSQSLINFVINTSVIINYYYQEESYVLAFVVWFKEKKVIMSCD